MGDPVLAQESCTLTAQALLARKKQLAQTCCLHRFPYVSHASVHRAVYLYQHHRSAASSGGGFQQEDNGPHTIGAAQHLLAVVVVPGRVSDPGGERVDADRYPPRPRGRASRAWPRRRCRGTGRPPRAEGGDRYPRCRSNRLRPVPGRECPQYRDAYLLCSHSSRVRE